MNIPKTMRRKGFHTMPIDGGPKKPKLIKASTAIKVPKVPKAPKIPKLSYYQGF